MKYLVGKSYNRMFSDTAIQQDEHIMILNDMEDHSYKPETKPWKYYYDRVCEDYKNLHKSIPKPPSKKTGK